MTNELNIFTCSASNTWFRGQERNMSLPFLHLGVGYFSIQTVHMLVYHLDEFSIDRCLETVDNNLKRKQLCVLKEPHTKYFFCTRQLGKIKIIGHGVHCTVQCSLDLLQINLISAYHLYQCCGAGGAEIISWSRSRNQLFRFRGFTAPELK